MVVFNFIKNNWGVIATLLFLVSELLGEFKNLKSNSIFGLVVDFLRGEYKKARPKLDELINQPPTT